MLDQAEVADRDEEEDDYDDLDEREASLAHRMEKEAISRIEQRHKGAAPGSTAAAAAAAASSLLAQEADINDEDGHRALDQQRADEELKKAEEEAKAIDARHSSRLM